MAKLTWGIAVVCWGLLAPHAVAAQNSSVYTSLNLKKCRIIKTFSEDGGTLWICKGFRGLPVRVAEGDLRFFVSYGANADTQRAARQTLEPFNSIHTVLEWRIEQRDGRGRPFATILRYFWEMDGNKGQTLVVTRLGPQEACHVAYVRADGNPKANEIARAIADATAKSFDCKADQPARIGSEAALIGAIPR